MYHLWKKGQATQEVFKDVLRSCTKKKIREMKAQLELSLATSVQDNALININKRRTKENLHSLLECPSPKTRKRLRYLTPSLPQSSTIRPFISGQTAPELVDRDREQKSRRRQSVTCYAT